MPRFTAKVIVTLHYSDDRSPVQSEETALSFDADSEDPDGAWEEFLEGSSSLDMVTFPEGVDPFDDAVLEENWEYTSIKRAGR